MDRGGDINTIFKKFIDKKQNKKVKDDKQNSEFNHLLDNLDIKQEIDMLDVKISSQDIEDDVIQNLKSQL